MLRRVLFWKLTANTTRNKDRFYNISKFNPMREQSQFINKRLLFNLNRCNLAQDP